MGKKQLKLNHRILETDSSEEDDETLYCNISHHNRKTNKNEKLEKQSSMSSLEQMMVSLREKYLAQRCEN